MIEKFGLIAAIAIASASFGSADAKIRGANQGGVDIDAPVSAEWSLDAVGNIDGADEDDLIWRHDNGTLHYWKIADGKRVSGHDLPSPGEAWHVRAAGDVDADGDADIIFQHDNTQVHVWTMQDGRRVNGYDVSTPVGSEWRLVSAADIDGDGDADIVWQRSDSQIHFWTMQAGQRVDGVSLLGPQGADWRVDAAGDIDGDGDADILFRRQSNLSVHAWTLQGGQRTDGFDVSGPVSAEWHIRGVGDMDGDGTGDIVWRHDNGQVHYWRMRPIEQAKRPVYVIAHRVLDAAGVTAALADGANAIEIDACAYYYSGVGWWADHDCNVGASAGDKMSDMFDRIRAERLAGKTVTFVWLDIKNPDYCETDDYDCSVAKLMDDARAKLQSVGVEVVLGFMGSEGKYGWNLAKGRLNGMEGIVANGELDEVQEIYNEKGADIPVSRRMMDYGYYNIGFQFGDCTEESYNTCTELKMGADYRNAGGLSKVFGWTTTKSDDAYVDKLLGTAGVDGVIYGFSATYYYDHADTAEAAADIRTWVANHSDTHRLATQDDTLF